MNSNTLAVSTYEKIAGKYTDLYFNDKTDLPQIDTFIRVLKPNARVLDAGSGPGEFADYLLKKGFDVIGIDQSCEMLRIAREKVPLGIFTQMDLRSLSYTNGTFDAILAAYSLIHIPSAEIPKTLSGFKRVLKPDGLVFLITQKGEPDHVVDEPMKAGEKMFFNFFSKERLAKFLTDSGFVIITQEEMQMNDPLIISDTMSDTIIYTLVRVAL